MKFEFVCPCFVRIASAGLRILLLAGLTVPAAARAADAIGPRPAAKPAKTRPALRPGEIREDDLSPMGLLARLAATGRLERQLAAARARARGAGRVPLVPGGGPPPADDEFDGPAGGQAEVTIAVDPTGLHVVIGFNDTRGFSLNPVSLSGFAYSDDGGATFTDGGQLPSVSNGNIGATLFPQVFGDPDIKFVAGGGGCQFIYASIMVKGLGAGPAFTGTAQTLSIHRSTDCGHTWTGPFEITAATNPTGVLAGSNARDAADKEFIDVDPDTGRALVSWTNFTDVTVIPGGAEIRTAFSDNVMSSTPPTWSAGVAVNAGAPFSESGSMPRFAGNGSPNAYVVWSQRGSSTVTPYSAFPYANQRFSRSIDNGATWSAPITLGGADSYPIDYIPGNDRVHQFPGLAVDNSTGPNQGSVYVVWANNASQDGADVVFQRSTNGGVSFSPPLSLNGRPGGDRAQWFPYVSVDSTTGRISIMFYDQGISGSGDVLETTWTYSDDGGGTWSRPSPLSGRPFHGGYGNDTGQPNLGDYVGCTAQSGTLFATWAGTPPVVSFVDGQPAGSFTVPDFVFGRRTAGRAALALGTITLTDSGGNGFIDPAEIVSFQLPLRNMVTNAATAPVTFTGVSATLSTSTPNVTVLQGTRAYPDIAPGATATNTLDFIVQPGAAFVPGTKIDFALAVTAAQGATTLLFTQNTGTPVATTIFSENFNGTAPGSLPVGWGPIHQGGNNTVPWTTNNAFAGTSSNGLFHANANDGLSGNHTRFERVATPNITIPASAEYVTLDFDIAYDLEDAPDFNVLAYDGATLRITDFTAGHTARANLVEAFAESITTGTSFHFPKHLPRSNSTAYFQDMSVWSGDSGGFKHVSMRLPGMAGTTVQLRFDFTQDSGGTCTDARPTHLSCGVLIDNIVMKSVTSAPPPAGADLAIGMAAPSGATIGASVTYTLTVANNGPSPATNAVVTDTLPSSIAFVSCASTAGGVCGGTSAIPTVTFASLASGASATITLVGRVVCATPNGAVAANSASVAASSPSDPIGSNNAASANTSVTAPAAPVASNNGPLCAGGNLQLGASLIAGATYAWTGPNGFSSGAQNPTIGPVTTAAAGTYTVVATLNGCALAPAMTTAVVNATPATPVITAPAAVPAGGTGRVASVPAVAGSSFGWTIANGTITGGQGTNQITFTAGAAGTLTLGVTETNGAGCASASGSANVSVVASGSAMLLYPLPPCRLLDTRNAAGPLGAPPLAPAGAPDRAFAITGVCGIPSDAQAVSVNVTITRVQASGELLLYRGDGSPTTATTIVFRPGVTRANNTLTQLAIDGSGTFKVQNSSAGTLDFIVDVNGFYR